MSASEAAAASAAARVTSTSPAPAAEARRAVMFTLSPSGSELHVIFGADHPDERLTGVHPDPNRRPRRICPISGRAQQVEAGVNRLSRHGFRRRAPE